MHHRLIEACTAPCISVYFFLSPFFRDSLHSMCHIYCVVMFHLVNYMKSMYIHTHTRNKDGVIDMYGSF